jgi:hypothetical protein
VTWQLAQGTVEFRDEERRHRNRSEQITQVRREVSLGSAIPIVSSPGFTAPPADALCPTCLTDLDETYCPCCGKVVRA